MLIKPLTSLAAVQDAVLVEVTAAEAAIIPEATVSTAAVDIVSGSEMDTAPKHHADCFPEGHGGQGGGYGGRSQGSS